MFRKAHFPKKCFALTKMSTLGFCVHNQIKFASIKTDSWYVLHKQISCLLTYDAFNTDKSGLPFGIVIRNM